MGILKNKVKSAEKSSEKINSDEDALTRLTGRITPEVVFSFCGAVGSGPSTVSDEIQKEISSYGYICKEIDISELIEEYADKYFSDWNPPVESTPKDERITNLQNGGDLLRDKFRNTFLAEMVVHKITNDRRILHLEMKEPEEIPRIAWFVDSLKHPDEVKLLRNVYGNMFYLFGIICPETKRKSNLIAKGIGSEHHERIMRRDASDKEDHGQQVLKTILQADFFIRSGSNTDNFGESITRFLGLIFGENISPENDEFAMYLAHSAALRSSCLSRQVGAAIMSESGELISTGRNDVPKPGGGLYPPGKGDERCYKYTGTKCWSDKYKIEISREISNYLEDKIKESEKKEEVISEVIDKSRIKNSIEYSRAVHAEMDAIVNAARTGVGSVVGATMYCTTFPCHYCTGHIIASGILRIYYIQPYEKSLAMELHQDAITFDPEKTQAEQDTVKIIPFEGVAPRQYINIFESRGNRKNSKGEYVKINKKKALPAPFQYFESIYALELGIVKKLQLEDIVKKL